MVEPRARTAVRVRSSRHAAVHFMDRCDDCEVAFLRSACGSVDWCKQLVGQCVHAYRRAVGDPIACAHEHVLLDCRQYRCIAQRVTATGGLFHVECGFLDWQCGFAKDTNEYRLSLGPRSLRRTLSIRSSFRRSARCVAPSTLFSSSACELGLCADGALLRLSRAKPCTREMWIATRRWYRIDIRIRAAIARRALYVSRSVERDDRMDDCADGLHVRLRGTIVERDSSTRRIPQSSGV